MPFISIITVNLNNLPGLQKTIDSVLSQTYTDFEYMVIDGGSTDGSRALVSKYADRFAYSVCEADTGVYHAMNKGISRATGEYIMFLNSGDFLVDDNVLVNVATNMRQEAYDVYYGNIVLQDEHGRPFSKQLTERLTLEYFEKDTINHQASFIRNKLFEEMGVYDERFTMAADHAFYLKAFLKGKQFKYLNLDMVHYELDGMSTVRWDEYYEQMKDIYRDYVPTFIKQLQQENRAYKNLLRQGIMKIALKVNSRYQRFMRSKR
jgi:glycosyltransferase involved in cell wall biosynthesis